MGGAMRKMGVYLGLLEDAEGEYAEQDFGYDEPVRHGVDARAAEPGAAPGARHPPRPPRPAPPPPTQTRSRARCPASPSAAAVQPRPPSR